MVEQASANKQTQEASNSLHQDMNTMAKNVLELGEPELYDTDKIR